MSPRRILFILIALVASGTTMFVGQAYLKQQRPPVVAEAPPPAPPVEENVPKVLVAAVALQTGTFVHREHLRWQPWPNGSIPDGYIVFGGQNYKPEDLEGASVVRSSLAEGEPITLERLARPGQTGFLAAALTPGKRAVTVSLSPTSGNAGFIFPGDGVDLIVTFDVKEEEAPGQSAGKAIDHRIAETILTGLKVLALDQRVDTGKREVVVARTATLEVDPKEAEIVAVAGELGKLSLSLRHTGDPVGDAAAPGQTADEKRGVTWTYDSDATQIIPPPRGRGTSQRVTIVRADKETQVDTAGSAQ